MNRHRVVCGAGRTRPTARKRTEERKKRRFLGTPSSRRDRRAIARQSLRRSPGVVALTRGRCYAAGYESRKSSIIVAPGQTDDDDDDDTTAAIPQVAKYQLRGARSINRFSIGGENWSNLVARNERRDGSARDTRPNAHASRTPDDFGNPLFFAAVVSSRATFFGVRARLISATAALTGLILAKRVSGRRPSPKRSAVPARECSTLRLRNYVYLFIFFFCSSCNWVFFLWTPSSSQETRAFSSENQTPTCRYEIVFSFPKSDFSKWVSNAKVSVQVTNYKANTFVNSVPL